jgi:branched-chain amino acid aminotransferase
MIMEQTLSIPIKVRKTLHSRIHEIDWDHLEFGEHATDHMLICDYQHGHWQAPEIIPFGDFSLPPTTVAFHYGQTIFEGLKAFRMDDGRVHLFRPQKHYDRMVRSAERLCMPMVSKELFLEGLHQFVQIDQEWVPGQAGSALYLRPFMIATDTKLRAHASENYRFAIVASPSGPYYQKVMRIKVEREYVRAPKGGTGYAKCGGNYGGAFYPTKKANEQGYAQVIWTDSKENRFIEEAGTMNIMFVINGILVTPPLSDSILDGITRDSLITLAREAGIPVEERPISVDELKTAFAKKTIQEAFGVGTAAVIAPIGTIGIDGIDYELPAAAQQNISSTLKSLLEDIRHGRKPDKHGWNNFI